MSATGSSSPPRRSGRSGPRPNRYRNLCAIARMVKDPQHISAMLAFMGDTKTSAELVLGTAQLGLAYGAANRTGQPSEDEANLIVRAAVNAGIRWIDTAAAYGSSEQRIGAAVPGSPARPRGDETLAARRTRRSRNAGRNQARRARQRPPLLRAAEGRSPRSVDASSRGPSHRLRRRNLARGQRPAATKARSTTSASPSIRRTKRWQRSPTATSATFSCRSTPSIGAGAKAA